MLRRCALFGLIFVLAAVMGACAPAPTPLPAATPLPPTASPLPATATPSSVMVVDSAKRTVNIPGVPQRIVSLAPSTTEIAFALGLGKRVVAVDTYSDYPAETKDLPKLKTFPVSLEQLVSFKPDLVLAAGVTRPDEIKNMEELKLAVLVVGVSSSSFDDILADILLVGQATGREAQAQQVTETMKQKVADIKAQVAKAKTKPRVYWELDATDPAKPYTPGPGSFIDGLIALAGGTNIAANAKSTWAQFSAEEIVAANPDIIILSDTPYGITVESVKARPGWATMNAVRNDKVLPIEDSLVSRPGPRVVDGLAAAARLIHPELFK
jgi:iron complex transport system substrate-binding protein